MNNIKVAIVHDWLTGMRGGEKCLEVFCELFPDATVFTLLHTKGSVSPLIEDMDIRTSFIQNLPGSGGHYRQFLPFFPFAIQSFDLTGYDLILSSSHCVAKGVRKPEKALHICYCYTPMRYAWRFFDEYFAAEPPLKRWLISRVIQRLKKWDLKTNKSVDYFISISDNIKNRILEYYNRESTVIYPPADVDSQDARDGDEDFYLIVSALVPYKRVDIAVRAFNENGKRLVIIGKGTELEGLKKASKSNIEFLGWASEEDLDGYYSGCKALIFPGLEDFGIVPVEAQAYGKPVIAFAAGGALETVVPFKPGSDEVSPTGVFFEDQHPDSLNEAIDTFEKEKHRFSSAAIRANAVRFSRERFKGEIDGYVKEKWQNSAGGAGERSR
ncbi:MAG: glycosyltransferase [Candidatus Tantalella remota]|nr:glycosyltransferase [Candidatus Tantalella remota]